MKKNKIITKDLIESINHLDIKTEETGVYLGKLIVNLNKEELDSTKCIDKMLMGGEFVMNKDAVNKCGQYLNRLNTENSKVININIY